MEICSMGLSENPCEYNLCLNGLAVGHFSAYRCEGPTANPSGQSNYVQGSFREPLVSISKPLVRYGLQGMDLTPSFHHINHGE